MSVYLDYNATAPIDPRVLETMVDAYKNHYGNADSRTHDFGNDSREIVEKARGQVAQLLNVSRVRCSLQAEQLKVQILRFSDCKNMASRPGKSILSQRPLNTRL